MKHFFLIIIFVAGITTPLWLPNVPSGWEWIDILLLSLSPIVLGFLLFSKPKSYETI
ncbi:hypothetical protein L6278_00105 [Candidatus Parcubacteria bacterium]|nr:hypothetical protein [Patescibacteria group bacterium]MBU4482339.1 hypothetical protein [Patescibacteria group bacterium]MCG2686522.1 hypothetical protein [Candidatus Parcubacteria bacterium]